MWCGPPPYLAALAASLPWTLLRRWSETGGKGAGFVAKEEGRGDVVMIGHKVGPLSRWGGRIARVD